MRRRQRRSALVLVQNLSVPFDRRVWQESRALRDAGYDVFVVCPKSRQHPASYEVVEGISIRRYPPVLEAHGLPGFLVEYAVALACQTLLAWRVALTRRVDVVQACNPPDLLFLVAVPLVLLRRTRFVFDHHDVSPELLVAKGSAPSSRVVTFSRMLERLTFGCAVVSIATNDSYRNVALTRGGMAAEDVFVVRSGPDATFQDHVAAHPLKGTRRFLVGYVGVMGVQEGLDYLLDAARIIVHDHGRDDVTFALAGSGPETSRLELRAQALGLSQHVNFLGRVSDAELVALLRSSDVCVNPDEVNAMNDISTMNKILEYMALGRPIVQFDVREGRVSAGDAALYAIPNDPASFAAAICRLLDDEPLRERMGAYGRERYERDLAWTRQVPRLVAAYDRALSKSPWDVNVLCRAWWSGWRRAMSADLHAPGRAVEGSEQDAARPSGPAAVAWRG